MSEFLVVSSTFARAAAAGDPAGVRPAGRLRRAVPAAERHRLRRAARRRPRRSQASYVPMFAHLGAGAGRRHLSAAAAGRLVPERREAARMRRRRCRSDRHRCSGRTAERAPPMAARRRRRAMAGSCRRASWPTGDCTLLGLWGDADAVHMALLDGASATSPSSRSTAPTASFPRSARCIRPAIRLERAIRDLYGLEADGRARHAALARSRPLGRDASARAPTRSAAGDRSLTPSCPPRARACTRSRSGRCMPASSSPDISASPPTARRWCGWRSGSATSTRASRA